jgi:N-terminal domain of unknown function (DUF4140)
MQAGADAPITQVTVFQNCAEVTRVLSVACAETGFCDIKLQGVPSIDPSSLRVEAKGECALQRVSYSEVPDQTEPAALPGQVLVSYCPNAHIEQPRFDVVCMCCAAMRRCTSLARILCFFPKACSSIPNPIYLFFRVLITSQICLEVLEEGNVELEVRYMVAGASWTSSYDVRADTTKQGSLTCSYYGEVQQVRGSLSLHFAILQPFHLQDVIYTVGLRLACRTSPASDVSLCLQLTSYN